MSNAKKNFEIAIQDADHLLELFDNLNKEGSIKHEELKRAAVIMSLTAWETYIEDIVTEVVESQVKLLDGSKIATFIKSSLEEELRTFNTPNSSKTKKIFERFLHIDVTKRWDWINGDCDAVRKKLNNWIKTRGQAVHRAVIDKQVHHLVNRNDASKCITFFKKIVDVTNETIENEYRL